jgi:hypothetical protein
MHIYPMPDHKKDGDKPQITILTDPVPCGFGRVWEPTKYALRNLKRRFKPLPHYVEYFGKYRGHHAVTRSMVQGMRKIGVRCTYNPQKKTEVSDIVVVPGGYGAARQAISWKRTGFIRKLILGTNLVDFPSEKEKIICAPEVDLNIVPSEWVLANFLSDRPELDGRVITWPAGVDVEYWRPSAKQQRREILVYQKDMDYIGKSIDITPYYRAIEDRGYSIRVIKYGKYSQQEYLQALQGARLTVGFSLKETQGIAWAEAWSTDVPTLVFRRQEIYYKGRHSRSSTAPYLSGGTGMFFENLSEFDKSLDYWESSDCAFSPRAWVLENMSDEIRCSELCGLAGIRGLI